MYLCIFIILNKVIYDFPQPKTGILKSADEYGTNPEDALKAEEKIQELTVEEFREAANTYFNATNYAEFILLPEKE